MDRERAEAHLRMLAEDEVRHAMLPSRTGIRVSRVAQALTAVGALDDETAKRILDEVRTGPRPAAPRPGLPAAPVAGGSGVTHALPCAPAAGG